MFEKNVDITKTYGTPKLTNTKQRGFTNQLYSRAVQDEVTDFYRLQQRRYKLLSQPKKKQPKLVNLQQLRIIYRLQHEVGETPKWEKNLTNRQAQKEIARLKSMQ